MRDGRLLNGFLFLCILGLMAYVFVEFYEMPSETPSPQHDPPSAESPPPSDSEPEHDVIDDYHCDNCSYEPLYENQFGIRNAPIDFPIEYPNRIILPLDSATRTKTDSPDFIIRLQ